VDKVAVAPLLLSSQLVFPKKLDSVLLLEPFLSRRRGRREEEEKEVEWSLKSGMHTALSIQYQQYRQCTVQATYITGAYSIGKEDGDAVTEGVVRPPHLGPVE